MVAANEVFQAANRIRARPAPPGGVKERVSVRTVRKELGGGSFSDIARELRKWRKDEDYRPAIEQADLPEAFERRIVAIGREVLEMARVEAARAKLADFVQAEGRRSAERDLLDEALEQVDRLEERCASLQAELERLHVGGAHAAPMADEPPVAVPPPRGVLIETAFGLKMAREADDFWGRVREAVEGVVRRHGPMAVHPLLKALPASLKREGEGMGLPLTEAWLRYHLLRLVQDGAGLSLDGYRFGLAVPASEADEAAPTEASPGDAAAEMGNRRFWLRFVREVHDLLSKEGPMTVEQILDEMGPEWVEASKRFQKVTPGRLRYKLKGRIAEDRPFEELADGRFAALPGEAPWDGRSPAPTAAGNG
ncbi:hypothetical protein LPLAFNJD_LOCUS1957 [Methylorubrum aminovorans]